MQPAILAAEKHLIETIGEFHGLEGVADPVDWSNLDAVACARDADHRALVGDDLSVVVIDHETPAGSRVEPPRAAGAPIGWRPERIAVPRHVLEVEIGAARLGQMDVAVERAVPAAIAADLELGKGGRHRKNEHCRGDKPDTAPAVILATRKRTIWLMPPKMGPLTGTSFFHARKNVLKTPFA
jgi:hypothetical protein